MLIKKVTLNGFKRFSLSGVDNFEFEPKNGINIFTDRNGAGKSSLLSQLNPLPPERKDFKDDGYKVIEITHQGHNYLITSKGLKHSILKDGEELNPGGTRKVQLELVENIFNIDPHTLNVVNGNNPFTLMSPSERKKWLTEISTVDYSYAISIYQKLLERRRDLTAWVKLNSEKILNIQNYLNSVEDYETIIKQDIAIKEFIENILKEYIPTQSKDDVFEILDQLKKKNSEFLKYEHLLSIDFNKLQEERQKLSNELNLKQHTLKESLEKFDRLKKDGDKDLLTSLEKKRDEVKERIKNKPSSWSLNNMEDIFQHFKDKLEILQNASDELSNNDIDMSLDVEKMEQDIINKRVFISKLEEGINKHNHILGDFNTVQNIKLPSCSSCGSPYDIKGLINTTTSNIQTLKSRLELEQKELNRMYTIKNAFLKRKYMVDNIKTMLMSDEYIKEAFKLATLNIPKEINYCAIETTIEVISMVYGLIKEIYIPSLLKLDSIHKQIIPLLEQSLLDKNQKDDLMKTLSIQIETLTDNINNIKSKINGIDINVRDYGILFSIREEIKELLKKLNIERKNMRIKFENSYIETTVNKLKEKNVENVKILEQYRSSQLELEKLKKEKDSYEKQIIIVSKLLDVLSPSSGLIAKSINSFLGVFINDMNSIINSVWSYKMKILPCDLFEGDDLDYKFKVEVNDDFIVEDIIKLSSSMREIVDLAFRLVFIKYKNYDQIPIILDEFGRTMDKDHRVSAFNMIDQVICSNFEQIFLVSHFEEMYGRFKNAHFASIS